jgi:hypothetical protein
VRHAGQELAEGGEVFGPAQLLAEPVLLLVLPPQIPAQVERQQQGDGQSAEREPGRGAEATELAFKVFRADEAVHGPGHQPRRPF